VISAILSADSGRVEVKDASGAVIGTLDAAGVHRQLRRSVRDGASAVRAPASPQD